MQLPLSTISRAIGAETPIESDTIIKTLLTDSRDLTEVEGTLFFALRTSGNDGHRYIPGLYRAGVRCFVIDSEIDTAQMPEALLLRVPDVLSALQDLAAFVRCQFDDVPVIGITGSRGKTVVKEQLFALLRGTFKNIVRSPRSYNSQIGVPLSLWQMDRDTDLAIIEAGISLPGEMQRLQWMIRPDIGVFTSLTDEHSEGFADDMQKAAEKAGLFIGCSRVFVGGCVSPAVIDIISRSADCECVQIEGDNEDLSRAVAAAMCIGAGVTPPDENTPVPHNPTVRINVTSTLKHCLLVHDSFTSDVCGLPAALTFARRLLTPGRTLTAVMGSPLPDDPTRFIEMLIRADVSRLILIGNNKMTNVDSDKIRVEHAASWQDFTATYTISDFSNEVILIRGENGSGAEDALSMLEAPRHETVMEVDLGAIVDNFNFFRSHIKPTTGIVAMVKADGYGVGALELAKTLQAQGASYLAVAVIDEGAQLRRAGITMPIIVMNPIGTNYKALFDNRLEPSVFSMRELRLLLDNAARYGITDYPVHIKLDTGMHRLGFLEQELPALIETLLLQRHLHVASIFSHLATADCLGQDAYTQSQLDCFDRMSNTLKSALPYTVKRHILNTAGILRYPQYQYDMVRLGIGLYGVSPIPGYDLRTVATLLTSIISVKEWGPGITIGYGRRGKIVSDSLIATIPIGYADGLNRHLSGGAASFLVKGKWCPVVGNICMDQCMIDITGTDAGIGDTVEIFGAEASIQRISDTLGTIPYEILTSVSPRVKRIYFRD